MYKNAQYVSDYNGAIVGILVDINGVQTIVPISESNTDYQNIMTLVAEGKLTIAPAEAQ